MVKSEGLHAGRVTLDAGRIMPWSDHRRDAHQPIQKHRHASRITLGAGRVSLFRKQIRNGNRGSMKERSARMAILWISCYREGISDYSTFLESKRQELRVWTWRLAWRRSREAEKTKVSSRIFFVLRVLSWTIFLSIVLFAFWLCLSRFLSF